MSKSERDESLNLPEAEEIPNLLVAGGMIDAFNVDCGGRHVGCGSKSTLVCLVNVSWYYDLWEMFGANRDAWCEQRCLVRTEMLGANRDALIMTKSQ